MTPDERDLLVRVAAIDSLRGAAGWDEYNPLIQRLLKLAKFSSMRPTVQDLEDLLQLMERVSAGQPE